MNERTLGATFGKPFERDLIWLLLVDPDFSTISAETLSQDMFEDAGCAGIIEAAKSIHAISCCKFPSAKTISAHLKHLLVACRKTRSPRTADIEIALLTLGNIAARKNHKVDRDFIRDRLSNFITYRATQRAIIESVDLLEQGEFDKLRQVIDDATQIGRLRIAPDIGLDFSDFTAKIAAYENDRIQVNRMVTGITTLDRILQGGMKRGTLGLVIAPPGKGKTMSLVQFGALALSAGYNVLHVTLEISEVTVSLRYESRLIGFPINDIRSNLARYKSKIQGVVNNMTASLVIKEWPCESVTVYDIMAFVNSIELRTKRRPDVVIVDYADLLRPIRILKEQRFEVRDTYAALTKLAKEANVAVWTASQVTKESARSGDILDLSAAKESGAKTEISDVVISLNTTREEETKGKLRIAVLKNRLGGRQGTIIECSVNTDTQTIKESITQPGKVAHVVSRGPSGGVRHK